MPKTKFKSVDDYIALQPEAAQGVLERVRNTIRKALPGAEESVSYNIPVYKLRGSPVIYFAGWRRHFSLYPVNDRMIAAFREQLEPYEIDKGTIRFPLTGPVPVRLIDRIARFRAMEAAERKKATAAAKPRSLLRRPKEMADQNYVSAVNSVISICKDAEKGFEGAAKAVHNPALKSVFDRYSMQRGGFVRELQQTLRQSGVKPEDPSGAAGVLHSGWITLKGVLTGHSEHQILVETERGEDLSVKTYRDALSGKFPSEIRSVLETQFAQVQEAHDRIRTLRDEAAEKQ